MDKQPQIVRQQFQVLLDRSNKRFGKLRELQTRGDHSWAQAQALFHKTFESFNRLWHFQLTNRAALLESGLQRCELGGIANKIGQLYYNYYLRSGDTGALLESYTFYDAVHTRQYFASVAPESSAAAARQMRFYARFVVVCLFLHRREEAMQLMQELQASVSSYMLQYGYSADAQEWQLVVNEVAALMAADQLAMPLPRSPLATEVPYTPPLRCRLTGPAAACAPHRPRLQEAILVSYRPRQVKVAELPLELYRMAQALEWTQHPQDRDRDRDPQHPPQQQQQQSEEVEVKVHKGAVSTAEADQRSPAAAAAAAGEVKTDAEEAPPPSGSGGCGSGGEADGTASARREGATAASTSPSPAHGRQNPEQQQQPAQPHPASSRAGPSPSPSSGRTPPRQLLHRPTAQRLLSALLEVSAGLDQAAAGERFVLLYISADAAAPAPALAPSLAAAASSHPHHTMQQPCTEARGDEAGDRAAAAAAGEQTPPPPPQPAAAAAAPRQLLLCPPPHHHGHGHSSHLQKQYQQQQGAGAGAPPNAPGSTAPAASPGAEAGNGTQPQRQSQSHADSSKGQGATSGGGGGGGRASVSSSAATAAAAADGLLSPDELLAATRRRLMLVLDSDMGPDFAGLQGRERAFPLLCVMAPPWQALGPDTATATATASEPGTASVACPGPGCECGSPQWSRSYGSLTSMALSCPAQALCAMAGQQDPQPADLQRLQDHLDRVLGQLGSQMAEQLAAAAAAGATRFQTQTAANCGKPMSSDTAAPLPAAGEEVGAGPGDSGGEGVGAGDRPQPGGAASPSPSSAAFLPPSSFAAWAPVFEDCLARRLLLHFALYRACVAMHPRRNSNPAMAPACFPPLPPAADPTSPLLRRGLLRAAELLGRPGALGVLA